MPETACQIWDYDNAIAEEAIIGQCEFDSVISEYGENDFVVEFLREQGLWKTLVSPRALLLKKENGKDVEKLNGIMAVKELAGVKCIGNTKRLLNDAHLMSTLGFNLEAMIDKEKWVACQNTLRNHSNRIPTQESYHQFYKHVKFLREKKWLRGGEYAADGYEIEITVDEAKTTYQDAGKVWSDKENRWKYGYKLLLLVNIADGRERVVGVILDKIQVHETKMLRRLFRYIRHYVCPIEEMISTLIVDRAYWDEKLMRYLKEQKGIDFIMLAKDNLCMVKDDLRDLIKQDRIDFKPYQLKNPKYYQRQTDTPLKKPSKEKEYLSTELAIERNLDYAVFKDGYLNIVIRRERHKDGKPYYIFYVTTLPIKSPITVVEKYHSRTTIENDVNRELDQRWFIRSLAGRSRNIMLTRIMMVLKLFNCEKIMEMKVKKKYEEIKKRQREREHHSFFNDTASMIAYVPEKNVFGIFRARQWNRIHKHCVLQAAILKTETLGRPLTADDLREMLPGR